MLTPEKLDLAHRTISPNVFHHIVMHHAKLCKSLSVVRMGDGEAMLMQEIANRADDDIVDIF